MKASCVSVEVLMTFRTAVEILGPVQTHSGAAERQKKTNGRLVRLLQQICSSFVNFAYDSNNTDGEDCSRIHVTVFVSI